MDIDRAQADPEICLNQARIRWAVFHKQQL